MQRLRQQVAPGHYKKTLLTYAKKVTVSVLYCFCTLLHAHSLTHMQMLAGARTRAADATGETIIRSHQGSARCAYVAQLLALTCAAMLCVVVESSAVALPANLYQMPLVVLLVVRFAAVACAVAVVGARVVRFQGPGPPLLPFRGCLLQSSPCLPCWRLRRGSRPFALFTPSPSKRDALRPDRKLFTLTREKSLSSAPTSASRAGASAG